MIFEEELGGASDWGLALTVGALGGVLGSVTALRWRPRRPIVASFLLYTGCALPLAALAVPLVAVATAGYFCGVVRGLRRVD